MEPTSDQPGILWAAGASAGGNLFKQQGEGRTVAGQVAQLPTR
jgi:hypothetical protein